MYKLLPINKRRKGTTSVSHKSYFKKLSITNIMELRLILAVPAIPTTRSSNKIGDLHNITRKEFRKQWFVILISIMLMIEKKQGDPSLL